MTTTLDMDVALAALEAEAEAGRDGLLGLRLEAKRRLEGATNPAHLAEGERLFAFFDEQVGLCQELIGLYRSMRDAWARVEEIRERMEGAGGG